MMDVVLAAVIAIVAIISRAMYLCGAKFLVSNVGMSPFEILY